MKQRVGEVKCRNAAGELAGLRQTRRSLLLIAAGFAAFAAMLAGSFAAERLDGYSPPLIAALLLLSYGALGAVCLGVAGFPAAPAGPFPRWLTYAGIVGLLLPVSVYTLMFNGYLEVQEHFWPPWFLVLYASLALLCAGLARFCLQRELRWTGVSWAAALVAVVLASLGPFLHFMPFAMAGASALTARGVRRLIVAREQADGLNRDA